MGSVETIGLSKEKYNQRDNGKFDNILKTYHNRNYHTKPTAYLKICSSFAIDKRIEMNITEYMALNGGYISSADAKKVSLYNQLLYGTRAGQIVRVRRGVYALNNGLAKQMIDVETLIPGGVLCLYSAWSYHELTTQIPQAYHIAVERTRRVTLPVFPPIELSFMTQKAYELGIIEVEIDGFKVKVYDLEKSVCDAIKYRNKIGLDVSSEIFNNYLSRKDRDITRLYEYASLLRVGKKIDELIKFIL